MHLVVVFNWLSSYVYNFLLCSNWPSDLFCFLLKMMEAKNSHIQTLYFLLFLVFCSFYNFWIVIFFFVTIQLIIVGNTSLKERAFQNFPQTTWFYTSSYQIVQNKNIKHFLYISYNKIQHRFQSKHILCQSSRKIINSETLSQLKIDFTIYRSIKDSIKVVDCIWKTSFTSQHLFLYLDQTPSFTKPKNIWCTNGHKTKQVFQIK